MKLSEKRQTAIYGAVHEEIMRLRIELARGLLQNNPYGNKIDALIAQSGDRAAMAALKAAKGKA